MHNDQCGHILPKSGLILPQIVEISPSDVENSFPRPLFRNHSNSIVKLYLMYTHPIDHHLILSISYPYQFLFAPSVQKGMRREKIGQTVKYFSSFTPILPKRMNNIVALKSITFPDLSALRAAHDRQNDKDR